MTTNKINTEMPVMVKKRLFAAASSALTLVFFFGLLIFRFAMIFSLTDEELVKRYDL
jgi:hypothetical protein